jgi:hypothetical protein
MSYAVGQAIVDVITLRDEANVAILGLLEDDFATLEAFLVTTPAETALVALDELGDGQYSTSFSPTSFGVWALHWIYDVNPDFLEETKTYTVAQTAEIVVVTAGGTWTYNGDLEDPIQEARFLIQDTDGEHPLFTDNEISYALGESGGRVRRAAVSLVERLMARYAAMADTTELDLSVRASQLYEHAKDLHASLSGSFSNSGSVRPYAGGISASDVAGNLTNTDRVRRIFDKDSPYRIRDYGRIV